MKDIPLLLKTCLKTSRYPEVIALYLEYVCNLDFTQQPDYNHCRKLLRIGLRNSGNRDDGCLDFPGDTLHLASAKKKGKRKKKLSVDEETENIAEEKPKKLGRMLTRQPCRPAQTNRMRKLSSPRNTARSITKDVKTNAVMVQSDGLDNPTPAMLEILKKISLRKNGLANPVITSSPSITTNGFHPPPKKRRTNSSPVVISPVVRGRGRPRRQPVLEDSSDIGRF